MTALSIHNSSLRTLNHPFPQPIVDDTSRPKRRHNPAHPRKTAPEPVPPHPPHSLPPPDPIPRRTVIQIQAPEMQRRAQQLHPRRRQELRRALSAEAGFDLFTERWQQRRNQRRKIERCKDRERIADGEERVAGCRHGGFGRGAGGTARETRGGEHFGELRVLVEAEGHVHGADGGELGGAG